MFERGQVVISLAGRDCGHLLAVMSTDEAYAYVCDGKERPLDNPKRKNLRHISEIGRTLTQTQMNSDRALRKALAIISADMK